MAQEARELAKELPKELDGADLDTGKPTRGEHALKQGCALNTQMTAPAPHIQGELGAVPRKQENFLIAQQTIILWSTTYAALPTQDI